MDHDEQFLPTTSNPRRSLFDESREPNQDATTRCIDSIASGIFEGFPDLPEDNSETYYPPRYVEKLKTEIEQWTMEIEKTLEENEQFKKEKMELKDMVVDEKILSKQQLDFLASINPDEYMKKAKDFCDRVAIFKHVLQYKPETEAEYWYRAAKEIEKKVVAERTNK